MVQKPNKRKQDIGWQHGEMIENNHMWTKCKYCGKEMRGGGVSRLKVHIASTGKDVERCDKCPTNVSKAMREHIQKRKGENEEVKAQAASMRETLLEPIRRKYGDFDDISDESDDGEISAMERQHLKIAMRKSVQEVSGNVGSSSQRGEKRKADFFGSSKKDLSIEEMDPSIYRNRECSQQKISNMLGGNNLFKIAKHAIGKWFIYSNIAPNAADNVYFQGAIDAIAKAGVGVKGPTPYEITGPILDAEIEEIQDYVENFKKKWDTYGVTIMCDGWTGTTKLSIINFLIYCDGKIVFYKSIDASERDKDANYIYELMDDIVEEIGKKYVVQVITDNGSAYKKAGELLMRKRKHLYWSPCAAHCIDLILEEFADKSPVKSVIEPAKKVSNFIYNHNKVLAQMRIYTDGKNLLRPGATRFATNYIAIESIVEHCRGCLHHMIG